jgi:2-polyprenyl-3-methyl-5-hydroxy-6-metoxy-1,4-benzoquinol methylase
MRVQEVKAAFDNADKYLRGNSAISVRVSLISDMIKDLSYSDYVELGCGDGTIALSLLDENKKLVLVDISNEMIRRAKEKTPPDLVNNVEYIVCDIYSYKPNVEFDLVICVGVLAHVPSIEELITRIGSLLKKDGYLILQFTEANSLFGWFIYKFMKKAYGSYEVNKTSYSYLKPLLENGNLKLLRKKIYSDSSIGLSLLSFKIAYKFKLFTSRVNLSQLFSEVILLLKRVPE